MLTRGVPLKKKPIVLFIAIGIAGIILIGGGITLAVVIRENISNNKGETDEQANENGEEGQNSDNILNMTELWSTYYDETWRFGLKYPKDLTYRISDKTDQGEKIEFVSGATVVFSIRITPGSGDIDNDLSSMISSQCSEGSTYSNVSYNTFDYREAVDVPDAECLASHGINRTVEVASFGRSLQGVSFFILTNYELNDEQRDAVLGTLYFDEV